MGNSPRVPEVDRSLVIVRVISVEIETHLQIVELKPNGLIDVSLVLTSGHDSPTSLLFVK